MTIVRFGFLVVAAWSCFAADMREQPIGELPMCMERMTLIPGHSHVLYIEYDCGSSKRGYPKKAELPGARVLPNGEVMNSPNEVLNYFNAHPVTVLRWWQWVKTPGYGFSALSLVTCYRAPPPALSEADITAYKQTGYLTDLIMPPIGTWRARDHKDDSPRTRHDDVGGHSSAQSNGDRTAEQLLQRGDGERAPRCLVRIEMPGHRLLPAEVLERICFADVGLVPWTVAEVDGQRVMEAKGLWRSHTWRWHSAGNIVLVESSANNDDVVKAYLGKYPSDIPADAAWDVTSHHIGRLELMLARLRSRVDIQGDDRLFAYGVSRQDCFSMWLGWLDPYENLWTLGFRYREAQERAYRQFISDSDKNHPWNYQGYIDALMPLRQQMVTEVEAFLAQARTRGLVYTDKTRRPPEIQGVGQDKPAIMLGPDRK